MQMPSFSKRRTSLTTAIAASCVAALGMLAMDGQDSGPLVTPGLAPLQPLPIGPSLEPALDGSSDPTQTWTNWECVRWSECPKGIRRNADKSFVGCTYLPAPDGQSQSCSGKCTACAGVEDGVPVKLCYPAAPPPAGQQPKQCAVATSTQPCGITFEFTKCFYSFNEPSGETIRTPNNCYCGGIYQPVGGGSVQCFVNPCN